MLLDEPFSSLDAQLRAGVRETTLRILREAGVELITLGQYLQPSWKHLAIDRFPEPATFAAWDQAAREMGFTAVASGPLVRSSYRAGLLWEEAMGGEPVVTRDSTGSAISHLNPSKELLTASVSEAISEHTPRVAAEHQTI